MELNAIYNIYRLLQLKGVGPVLVNKILKEFLAEKVSLFELQEEQYSSKILAKYLDGQQISEFYIEDNILKNQIDEMLDINAGFLTIDDSEYPARLKVSLNNHTPPVLSYLGNLRLLGKKSIGFCGAREASEKGLVVAEDCAKQLALNNIVVVSGHAKGIDQKTHFSALYYGGETIIVLAEGLLNFSIRKILKDIWDWNRVLVISEYLPRARWNPSRAMQRNSTIIALSISMILIEAGKNGGSMDAGLKTLSMNKKLFTPIYEGMPEFAIGNQLLLKRGAISIKKSRSTGKANLSNLFHYITDFSEMDFNHQTKIFENQ